MARRDGRGLPDEIRSLTLLVDGMDSGFALRVEIDRGIVPRNAELTHRWTTAMDVRWGAALSGRGQTES